MGQVPDLHAPSSVLGTGGSCPNGPPYTLSDQYSYTPAGLVTGKRLAVTAEVASGRPRTTNLDTFQTYDNEGKVLSVTYPNAGPYTTASDALGRPVSLIDNQSSPETEGLDHEGLDHG